MIATVKYQVATYSGKVKVNCDKDETREVIIVKAKRKLINEVGSLPFGYESWKIIDLS